MAKRGKRKASDPAVEEGPPWDPKDIGDVSVEFLIETVRREGKFVYDLETTGLNPRKDRIEGVAFYVPNERDPSKPGLRAWFPFVEGTMDHAVGAEIQRLRTAMPQRSTLEKLRELWLMPDVIAIAHNGVFDMGMLYCASSCEEPIRVENQIADSMIADYIQDERARRYGLKIRVESIFKHRMTTYDEASGRQGVFGFARKKPLGAYAMDDCQWTYRLWKWAMDSIRRQDPPRQHEKSTWRSPLDPDAPPGFYSDLEKIYWNIEMEVQRVILEMEMQGCLIDWEWLVEVQRRLETQKADILAKIEENAGWAPNLRSPKQVSDFLYGKKEDGGLELPTDDLDYNEDQDSYSTGEKVISHFGKRVPVVKLLLDYRSLEVIDRSFCQKLIRIAQEEGRCYSHFKQTGTVIGRLSSADPINLMNQPRDKNLIRKAFCSRLPNEFDRDRMDMIFLDADYGQVELRMAAHLAREPNMIEVYRNVGGCANGADGGPCERFQFHECLESACGACQVPAVDASGQKVCGKCGSAKIKHQERCRHVDLHQRTSEDVGVKRNPLAKCLDGSTLLLAARGADEMRPQTIESLVGGIEPGEHRPITGSLFVDRGVGNSQWAPATSALKRHSRPTKIVVTKRAIVVATNDHRFQVIGDHGALDPATLGYEHVPGYSLVEAQHLEKGMKLPVAKMGEAALQGGDEWHQQRKPQVVRLNPFTKEIGDGPASITLDEDWAYFAGLFQGDGSASGNACTITHGHTDEYEAWRQVVRAACDKIGLPTTVSGDKRSTRLGSRVVRRYLEGLNLCKEVGDSGEKTMRVPQWVLDGGPSIQWSYIAGLFDTDGTIGSKIAGTASLTTKYPEFASQIAFLLRYLGMPILVQPGFNKPYERWYYTIHVLGEGLERFQRYCPLRHTDKAVKLQERNETIKRRCAPADDEVLLVLDGGERTVYDFQIETADHLYLQGGLVGHNNLNFGLLYRMGAPKFVTYADLYDEDGNPRTEYAEELIELWHRAYPGIAAWHARVIHNLIKRDRLIAYTLTRRRRRLDEEYKRNEFRAGTQAIQFMVSGSCQDIMKLAMVKIFQARNKKIADSRPAERKQWQRFRFMVQVHDEVVMEGPKCLEPEMVEMVRSNMVGVAPNLSVPLVADVRTGRTWDDTH